MSLRRRLALAAAVAVAAAVTLAALIVFLVVRGQLRDQVDGSLRAQQALVEAVGNLRPLGDGRGLPGPPPDAGGRAPYWQILTAEGTVVHSDGGVALPTGASERSVASGRSLTTMTDVSAGGAHLRLLAFHAVLLSGQSIAVELARPLGPIDRVLAHLKLVLLLVLVGGVALAAALGRLAAARVIRPLAEVARTAEEIGATDDLSLRLRVQADDEVGQLAARFNGMLARLEGSRAALDESARAQRRLVADASHELRTPVTSLRTNVEVLMMHGELPPGERERLLSDMVDQSEELTSLVSDLIEVARGDEPIGQPDDVRLDRIVDESLARARRNAPGVTFQGRLAPVAVEGVGERLSRAVNNLLDNSARHSPPGGIVEVSVDIDGIRVRDHGGGISPTDLPYVFDRFYRGESARSSPGSGLGLAIVRQVAELHGGSVAAENAPDGGAIFTLSLPGVSAEEQRESPVSTRAGGIA